ncbi:D-2-hydroxyacid dehydrogenase [Vibrio sp. AK197]
MNNFTHKLYILTKQDQTYRQLLAERDLEDLEITEDKQQATILLAAPPLAAKQLDEFPNLQWLQSVYAGVEPLMTPSLRQDYQLTNIKGIFGPLIAEYVLGYSLQYYRHFVQYKQQQSNQEWHAYSFDSLATKTMVILGTGSIGAHLAHASNHFGIKTMGINRSGIPPKGSPFDTVYHIQQLELALENADIIVNTLPNTEQTHHLLNQESLSFAKQALLFNVGRGNTLEITGLLSAIEQQNIAHAYLDVFDQEPLPQDSPLWHHPAITITPHVAAPSFPKQVAGIFADNYLQWRDGFTLNHQVDFIRGY